MSTFYLQGRFWIVAKVTEVPLPPVRRSPMFADDLMWDVGETAVSRIKMRGTDNARRYC